MKLKEIAVSALYNDYDCSVALNENGVTFLHSLNGTGKSTVLKLVNAVFSADRKVLEDIPFKKITLTFYNDVIINVNKRTLIECIVSTKEHDDTVRLEDVAGMLGVLYISPERTAVLRKDGTLVSAMDEYFTEFTEMFVRAKSHCEIGEPKELLNIDEERFEHLCQNLKAKLDYINECGLSVKIPADVKFPPNRYEYMQNRERYDRVVSSLSEWIDTNYGLAESITIFLDIVNKLFRNKDLSIDAKNNVCIMINGRTAIPASALSAGEKQILIMFYRLLFHAKEGSLVFLDEPEISLHVSWQQSIGSIFQDICRVRDLQMLIATHSPQIIHDKWDLAVELRSERA